MNGREKETLPRLSIVTPSYNQGEYLEECIDSILSQNYPNLEYVIMDGGSTDNSVSIIKKYEKHLAYWQSQPDGGRYAAITEGFRRTTGDVMAWLNSDGKYHPGALWRAAYTFSHYPDIDWITGRHTTWNADGNVASISSNLFRWSRRRLLDLEIDETTTLIQQENIFWRRSLWEAAGGRLDDSFDLAGDFELWIRFLRHSRLYSLDAFIAGCRIHEGRKGGHNRHKYCQQVADILAREKKLIANGKCTAFLSEPVPLSLYTTAVGEYRSAIEAEYRGSSAGLARGLESMTIQTVFAGGGTASPAAGITIATSIAPFNLEKQKAAVASWFVCGFRVVSLNVAAEIAILESEFPDVEFVPVTRDGSKATGKPLIYFDDILGFFRTLGEGTFGIINSDIYLIPDRECISLIMREARDSMVYGSRVDVKSLQQLMGPVYTAGFDFFFFDKSVLGCYPASNFMLGMPWWDYWAPIMPHFDGRRIKLLDAPFAYHVEHEKNYSDAGFERFGQEFSEGLISRHLSGLRDHFTMINPKISYEVDVNRLVPQTIQYLYAQSSLLRVPSLDIAAMNARGEAYLDMGEADWAEVWFRRTLERDGHYLPALNNLAVLYWNTGRTDAATEQLGIALEIAPTDRTTVLNCGAVLTALHNIPEARSLYENYLAHCPVDAQMRQLSEALAQHPRAVNAMPAR